MAPGLTESYPTTEHRFQKTVSRAVFPDGIKTSGQHPPLHNELRPFVDFPKKITGPTVWKTEDYINAPEKWVHRFTREEILEMDKAADDFLSSGTPLTGISKANFKLPRMSAFMESIRSELLNGKGFILFKGFPVEQWGNQKSAVAYMGLGTYLGYFVSQNGRGHVLGHVKDVGDDPKQIDRVRIYRTNARQFFHQDDSDIVGLLCIARALEGGESDIVSSHHVFNVLSEERPGVLKTLTQPIWYFDRKGEVSEGEEPYIKTAIFYLEKGANGRVYSKYEGSPNGGLLMLTVPDGIPTMYALSPASLTKAQSLPFLPRSSRQQMSSRPRASV